MRTMDTESRLTPRGLFPGHASRQIGQIIADTSEEPIQSPAGCRLASATTGSIERAGIPFGAL